VNLTLSGNTNNENILNSLTVSWLDKKVSLYHTHSDLIGRSSTFREVLLTSFGSNLTEIIALRQLDSNDPTYNFKKSSLKGRLQCYTPSAIFNPGRKGML